MENILSETLIASYFAETEDQKEVSLSTLTEIRKRILLKFLKIGQIVTIEWSRDSITEAVWGNPHYFFLGEDLVIKFVGRDKNKFLIDFYTIYNSKFENLSIKNYFYNFFNEVLIELGLKSVN